MRYAVIPAAAGIQLLKKHRPTGRFWKVFDTPGQGRDYRQAGRGNTRRRCSQTRLLLTGRNPHAQEHQLQRARQILGQPGEVWLPGLGEDKLVVVRE